MPSGWWVWALGIAAFAACSSFDEKRDEAPIPDGGAPNDASIPDVSPGSPDGGRIDAGPGACDRVLAFEDPFDKAPYDTDWAPTGAGTLAVWAPPDAGPGGAKTALHAAINVAAAADGGAGEGSVVLVRTFDVPSLRSVDLSYAILLGPSDFYAEIGCTLSLVEKNAPSLTSNAFNLVKFNDETLHLSHERRAGGVLGGEQEPALGMSVAAPARWYAARLHLQLGPTTVSATLDMTDVGQGVTRQAAVADAQLAGSFDRLELSCGIPYAGESTGAIEVYVDGVSLTACRR